MENTRKVFFEDDTAHWYIASPTQGGSQNEAWVGPLAASDVYDRVQKGMITWVHYLWKPGQSGWKRMCDIEVFQAAQPPEPSPDLQKNLQKKIQSSSKKDSPAPPPLPSAKPWFLCQNDTQYGPFAGSEIEQLLRVGKISGQSFLWKDGMDTWQRVEELGEFKKLAPPKPPKKLAAKSGAKPGGKNDNRKAPRRPLLAKILIADNASVHVAVCRDISVGGMQVLCEKIPGKVGSRIKLNVSSTSKEIDSFVAEGQIVRILDDGRGFSFRFEALNDRAKRIIETFVGETSAGETAAGETVTGEPTIEEPV